MNLSSNGKNTSLSNVTNISECGFWMLVNDREYFVPFKDYPVFLEATVAEIFSVRQLSPTQLYWESLDCDIEVAALEQPERFPLTFQPKFSRKRSRKNLSGQKAHAPTIA